MHCHYSLRYNLTLTTAISFFNYMSELFPDALHLTNQQQQFDNVVNVPI